MAANGTAITGFAPRGKHTRLRCGRTSISPIPRLDPAAPHFDMGGPFEFLANNDMLELKQWSGAKLDNLFTNGWQRKPQAKSCPAGRPLFRPHIAAMIENRLARKR